MNELEMLVDEYCRAWSAPSSDERERLLRSCLTDDATYSDPRVAPLQIHELLNHIADVHRSRPGAKVIRTSDVDAHHSFGRFHWRVVMPDGATLPEGIDFIELGIGGRRIRRIVGFFGPLTATC